MYIRQNMEKFNQFLNAEKLSNLIQKYVLVDGLSHTEAICEICKENEIEPEDIAPVIKGALKDKLEVEAIQKNIIKNNTARLY